MLRFISCLTVLAFLPAFFVSSHVALAQPGEEEKAEWRKALAKAEEEYRIYFRKPQNPLEFWAAIDYEVDVGKYDVAAVHLKQMLAQPEDKVTEDLLKIEELKGLGHFLRLRAVPRWFENKELNDEAKKNAEILIDRLSEALEKRLSDPVRIRKFIKNLSAPTPEVRAYAFAQLNRSKGRAAPYLIDELRDLTGKTEQERLKRAIILMDREVVIPFLETLKAANAADYQNTDVRLAVLDIVRRRDEKRAIPYLWHLSESEKYPAIIRSEAQRTLASLLDVDTDHLPKAKAELTQLAKDFAQHRMKYEAVVYEESKNDEPLPVDFKVKVWEWDGKMLGQWNEKEKKREPKLIPSLEADYLFALRYAREALDIDPEHKPAQVVMVNALLEGKFGDNLNQFILKPVPQDYHDLLATLDTELLMGVLDQAINERNVAVILPLVRILGQRGEQEAARTTNVGAARGLVRALYYPDRRVQREAVQAMLQLPGKQPSVVTGRMVDILQRFLKTEDQPQILAIAIPAELKMELRKSIKAAGFEPVFADDNKAAFAALHNSAAVEAILLHASYPDYELPYLLSNLRKDVEAGQTPILILAPLAQHDRLHLLTSRHRNIVPVLEGVAGLPEELKAEINQAVTLTRVPKYIVELPENQQRRVLHHLRETKGLEFTSDERKKLSAEALDLFRQMADGTIPGYSLHSAKDDIYRATRLPDVKMAEKAVETYASFPGTDVQKRLAGIVLDASANKQVRLTAAKELTRHFNKYGQFLDRAQLEDLRQAYRHPQTDADLRRQLALVVGTLPQSQRQSGLQLQDFQP